MVRYWTPGNIKDAESWFKRVLPLMKEFQINEAEAVRLKHVMEVNGEERERRYQWFLWARECDRVLAVIDRVSVPEVQARVLGFLAPQL